MEQAKWPLLTSWHGLHLSLPELCGPHQTQPGGSRGSELKSKGDALNPLGLVRS